LASQHGFLANAAVASQHEKCAVIALRSLRFDVQPGAILGKI